MTRRLSPTRLKIYTECKRRYWFEEVHGLRTYKEAFSFGTLAHAHAEALLSPDPSKVTIPKFKKLELVQKEQARIVGEVFAYIVKGRFDKVVDVEYETEVTLPGHGSYKARLDCVCEDDKGMLWLVDHKTSSNPQAYAKTKEALARDLQCVLYAYALMHETGCTTIGAHFHWVCSKATKRSPYDTAVVTELILNKDDIHGTVLEALKNGQAMLALGPDTMPVAAWQVDPFAEACEAFGGCDHKKYCYKKKKGETMSLLKDLGININETATQDVNPDPATTPVAAAPAKAPKAPPKAAAPAKAPPPPAVAPPAGLAPTAAACAKADELGLTGEARAAFILGYTLR